MGKVLGAFNYLLARLKEPSSYASISAALGVAGVHLDPGLVQDFLVTGSVIAGVLGFFVKEQTANV